MSVSSRSRAINLSVFEGMFSMASSDCKHRISPKDRVIAGKKGTIRELQIQGIQLTQHFWQDGVQNFGFNREVDFNPSDPEELTVKGGTFGDNISLLISYAAVIAPRNPNPKRAKLALRTNEMVRPEGA
jgi:hypothetical protein